MRHRSICTILSGLISLSLLGACAASPGAGSGILSGQDTGQDGTDNAEEVSADEPEGGTQMPEETEDDAAEESPEEGSVFRILVWDEEFKSRVESYYPGYVTVDDTHGTIGDVEVVWTVTETVSDAYWEELDTALSSAESMDADERVDLFLTDAEHAAAYVSAGTASALALSELGLDEEELSYMYGYTLGLVTDAGGQIRGAAWQANVSGLIYNRSIALAVLGTDDPQEVQQFVSDRETFQETAALMAAYGYDMTATVYDTWRICLDNREESWVSDDGVVRIDDSMENWAADSMDLLAAGATTASALWSSTWMQGLSGGVFCYIAPLWFVNAVLSAEGTVGESGGWGMTSGPAVSYWGGTWICAAAETDNASLAGELIRALCTDAEIMESMARSEGDCVNHRSVLAALAADDELSYAALGGQNPYDIIAANAEQLSVPAPTAYDAVCADTFLSAMRDYYDGTVSLDEAKEQYFSAVLETYPELKAQ